MARRPNEVKRGSFKAKAKGGTSKADGIMRLETTTGRSVNKDDDRPGYYTIDTGGIDDLEVFTTDPNAP